MTLFLHLLGGLEAHIDAVALDGRAAQRKRVALLAPLAAARTRGVSRDRLVALLWPEHDSARGRHQLAAATHDLRRAGPDDLLLAERDDLRLNPERVDCDLWRFEDALTAGRPVQAAEAYGGPLLDGFYLSAAPEFERWVNDERARLARRYADALEQAAALTESAGDLKNAVTWWDRRAALDPYDSRVTVRLMHAMVAMGNGAGAIARARTHCALIRADFEAEPDPEVERLAERVRAGDFAETVASTQVRGLPQSVVDPPAAQFDAARPRSRARLVAGIAALLTLGAVVAWMSSHDHLAPASIGATPSHSAVDPVDLLLERVPPTAVDPNHHTPNAAAVDLYLRGRREWGKRTKAGLQQAVVLFRQASDRDPMYAAADAGLADAYAMLGYFGFAPPEAMFPKARAAGLQALALDPRSGDAYAAIGQALAWQHRWAAAERAYRRSLAFDPNDATAHQWYALLLAYLGRSHEAAVETGEAARLDPLSVQINNMYGMMLYYDGDVSGALRQFEQTVFAEPDSGWVREDPWVLSNFARVAGAAGRHAEAIQLVRRALQTVPGNARLLHELAVAYIDAGDTSRARSTMTQMNPADPYSPVYRGLLEARMGHLDTAFAVLSGVRTWPIATLVTLNNEPGLTALRADPRFRTIRARLGMSP